MPPDAPRPASRDPLPLDTLCAPVGESFTPQFKREQPVMLERYYRMRSTESPRFWRHRHGPLRLRGGTDFDPVEAADQDTQITFGRDCKDAGVIGGVAEIVDVDRFRWTRPRPPARARGSGGGSVRGLSAGTSRQGVCTGA